MRRQEWVHFVMTGPDGKVVGESWFSPVKKVAAARGPGSTMFLDLNVNKLERYDEKEKAIYVSQPSATEREVVQFLDGVLQAIAKSTDSNKNGGSGLQNSLGSRSAVEEGGQRWTERCSISSTRRTAKINRCFAPAGEQLPADGPEGRGGREDNLAVVRDRPHPKAGPGDLFALNVPQDAKVHVDFTGRAILEIAAGRVQQAARPPGLHRDRAVAMPGGTEGRLRCSRLHMIGGLNLKQLMGRTYRICKNGSIARSPPDRIVRLVEE
jgi:hypothetical protein